MPFLRAIGRSRSVTGSERGGTDAGAGVIGSEREVGGIGGNSSKLEREDSGESYWESESGRTEGRGSNGEDRTLGTRSGSECGEVVEERGTCTREDGWKKGTSS